MILLDTDVLVDCLRGTPSARTWLAQSAEEPFAVPGIVAMELALGCSSRIELERTSRLLAAFPIIWPEPAEFASAYQLLLAHRLSSGMNIPDCIIAAMALSRGARLYTFNLKHFKVVSELDVQSPYSRP